MIMSTSTRKSGMNVKVSMRAPCALFSTSLVYLGSSTKLCVCVCVCVGGGGGGGGYFEKPVWYINNKDIPSGMSEGGSYGPPRSP